MNETTKNLILNIKKDFRVNMNGVAAAAIRNAGIDYKVSFGIELPRLMEIAKDYPSDHQLAQELWKDGVRESKILATILQPADTFFPEIADIWIDDIRQKELAEMMAVNLMPRLKYASVKAFEWIAHSQVIRQYCGYLTIVRLLRRGTMSDRSAAELIDQALTAIQDKNNPFYLRKAAHKALTTLADSNENMPRHIRKSMVCAGFDNDPELIPFLESVNLL